MSSVFRRLRVWARTIKRDAIANWIAARDPRTPLVAKIVAACVAAYAFSPIDLIPEFILGHVAKWRTQMRIDMMTMKPRKLSAVLS
ncbi:MAG: YkvA family protein [Paracoccus sp. (in: a-proteobacteria)]|uniref:YkvA family protein n=1 Tax=Paracoccus sp. TaxID=267 RepID=UPI0040593DE5